MPIVKEEHPGLRLRQYDDRIFEMWKKVIDSVPFRSVPFDSIPPLSTTTTAASRRVRWPIPFHSGTTTAASRCGARGRRR